MAKSKSGFTYQVRNEKRCLVKTLPTGGEVRKDHGEFWAYDSSGNYLGWTASLPEAEYMAANGYVNKPEEVSDLSLWTLWRDAIDSNVIPLAGEDGWQYLCLGSDIWMRARPDDNGWETELLNVDDVWCENGSTQFDILKLKFAAKPYVLE